MNPALRSRRLRFGLFVLDTRRVELLRDGVVVPLRPKPFALLTMLASNPGTVLRREELFAAIWPGAVVSDDSLTQAVREVRVALGDAGAALLRTVARHGYRFDAEVVASGPVPAGDPAPPARVESPDAAAPRMSLVVLPLDVVAGSDSGDWFCDPMTGDLTMDLGKVSGMFVISRETAFSYKDRQVDPRAVARELNVRYVVRGSVGRKGSEVWLNMALIGGETGRQQWAERFDLDLADLPRSLREVTGVVSRSLGVEVYRAEGQRTATLRPEQVQADDLAMKGWAVWLRGLSPENTFEALRLFEEAVARDPDSLRGWSGVGMMNAHAANYGWVADPAPARARQREALHQMERIDSEDMLTCFARTDPYYRRQDFSGLLQFAQTLIERFPNHPWSHHQHASALMRLGRFDECIDPVRRALRLGPRDTLRPVVRGMAMFCHFAAGRFADSVAEARTSLRERPTQAGSQMMLAAALAHDGQLEEAQQIVRENQGRPLFRLQSIQRLFDGTDPRLVQAREQLFATLKRLDVP